MKLNQNGPTYSQKFFVTLQPTTKYKTKIKIA